MVLTSRKSLKYDLDLLKLDGCMFQTLMVE